MNGARITVTHTEVVRKTATISLEEAIVLMSLDDDASASDVITVASELTNAELPPEFFDEAEAGEWEHVSSSWGFEH